MSTYFALRVYHKHGYFSPGTHIETAVRDYFTPDLSAYLPVTEVPDPAQSIDTGVNTSVITMSPYVASFGVANPPSYGALINWRFEIPDLERGDLVLFPWFGYNSGFPFSSYMMVYPDSQDKISPSWGNVGSYYIWDPSIVWYPDLAGYGLSGPTEKQVYGIDIPWVVIRGSEYYSYALDVDSESSIKSTKFKGSDLSPLVNAQNSMSKVLILHGMAWQGTGDIAPTPAINSSLTETQLQYITTVTPVSGETYKHYVGAGFWSASVNTLVVPDASILSIPGSGTIKTITHMFGVT